MWKKSRLSQPLLFVKCELEPNLFWKNKKKLTMGLIDFRFREAALLAAAQSPMFTGTGRSIPDREKYPYVFDAFAEARQTSAFVGGAKVRNGFFSSKL